MLPQILKIEDLKVNTSTAIIFNQFEQLSHPILEKFNADFLKERMGKGNECTVYEHPNFFFFQKTKEDEVVHFQLESARKAGSKLFDLAKTEKEKNIQVVNLSKAELLPAFVEGLLLSDYSFDKYKKEKEDFHLEEILICDNEISSGNI